MRVATGKVIGGKVVVDGEPLVEGSIVTVFLPEPGEEIELTSEEVSRLAQAVREADEGDFLEGDAEQFLDELDQETVKRRRLKLLKRASNQISEAAAWWASNRPSASR